MQDLNPSPDGRFHGGSDPNAGSATEWQVTTGADPLLDLMEQWETFYRRGEEPPPGWPALGDRVLRGALRDRIENQKRLYALLARAETPADESSDAAAPLPSFPGHEILQEIGRGGMGVVYKARDRGLGRIVAIKTIAEGRYATPDQRARFHAEARAVARLDHPNIIGIHAIGEHENRPYLSLEFAEGGNLSQRLAEKPMAPRQAAELVDRLARAVHAAHQAGVVHRDLKPSNVLLTAAAVPKISDFGLAKLLDRDSNPTRTGQLLGTPSYMAPEQTDERAKRVGPQADVYGLGAILYQALTGRPPFLGGSALETIRLVNSTEAVPPRQSRPDVPKDLETICLKCLEKEPLTRYSSALALADDLHRFLDDRPILARPVGPLGQFRRWGRRNPWVAGLSAAVLVCLLLGTGVSTALAIRAIQAEAATRQQRDRAETEAEISKAVKEFVEQDILAQASVFSQATPLTKPDPDLKVRTALDRAAEKIGNRFAGKPLVEASIRQTVGVTYHELGLLQQALPHLQRALDLRRRVLGPDDPDTLLAMKAVGALYLADGKHSEAEPLLVGALEGLRNLRDAQYPQCLDAMASVAELHYTRGQWTEAERLLVQAREANLAARGPDDPKTLEVINTLALVYLEQGKSELAEQTLVDVLRRAQKTLGVQHPSTLTIQQNLSDVYQRRDKGKEAVSLLKELIDAQTELVGRKHPATIASLVRLGLLDAGLGRLDEAEPLLSEALAGCRAALDRNHELTDGALTGLTLVYSLKNDRKKLESVLLEAVEITRFRWGLNNLTTALANYAAGKFFLGQRDYARAEPYFRDCLTYWVKNDPGHRDRWYNQLRLAVCVLARKNDAEAQPLLLAAYNGLKPRATTTLPADTSDLGGIIEQITQLRDEAGQLLEDVSLAHLRGDPALQAIVSDLQFPTDPFARP